MTGCCVPLTAGQFILSLSKGGTPYFRTRRSRDKPSFFCPLMELLAIRLDWQKTPAKSLVMSSVF